MNLNSPLGFANIISFDFHNNPLNGIISPIWQGRQPTVKWQLVSEPTFELRSPRLQAQRSVHYLHAFTMAISRAWNALLPLLCLLGFSSRQLKYHLPLSCCSSCQCLLSSTSSSSSMPPFYVFAYIYRCTSQLPHSNVRSSKAGIVSIFSWQLQHQAQHLVHSRYLINACWVRLDCFGLWGNIFLWGKSINCEVYPLLLLLSVLRFRRGSWCLVQWLQGDLFGVQHMSKMWVTL